MEGPLRRALAGMPRTARLADRARFLKSLGAKSKRLGGLAGRSIPRVPQPYRLALDGMPGVTFARRAVAPRERIPWLWIYLPVVIKWFLLGLRYRGLTLPTVANPMIESGGFRGESKASYLRQIDKSQGHWVAPWTVIDVPPGAQVLRLAAEAETAAGAAGIAYPIVVKPDIGASGYGVRLVHNTHELVDYLAAYPPGQRLMLQTFVPWSGEAGIFYVRQPGDARGRIYSLGLRYHPFVVGDGRSPLRELILADPRLSRRAKLYFANFEPRLSEVPAAGEPVRLATVASLRVGSLYRDGAAHVTDALTERLDGIARTMPEFYYGRFDVRFRTIEGLERGEDFRIIEINGAGAEAIHVWDPDLSIGMAYRIWFDQHEILFAIGARNRERGFRPMTLRQIIAMQWKESRLLRSYPDSN